jgi:hypothetical protein
MTDVVEGAFPVGRCASCAREVLTHVHADACDEERRLCLHCDAELDPGEVRWVGTEELAPLGYALDAGEEGCGRPGCGRGNCGNRR